MGIADLRVTIRPPTAERPGYVLVVSIGDNAVREYAGATIDEVNAAIAADPASMIDMKILTPPDKGVAVWPRSSGEAQQIGDQSRRPVSDSTDAKTPTRRDPDGTPPLVPYHGSDAQDELIGRWQDVSLATIVADVRQIILDAMDIVEQTDAEQPLIAAYEAIEGRRAKLERPQETTLRAIQRTAANAPEQSAAIRHIAELAEAALKGDA